MRRRTLLSSCCLAASGLAGCVEFEEEPEATPQTDDDEDSPFLEEGETPESDGAEKFLETVAEVTGGRTGFNGNDDTWRIRFSEEGDTWEIRYNGTPHSGEERFREEFAELAIAFASHRPDGVSLEARSGHECTAGHWQVSADDAAAYEHGDIDRDTFVDRIEESAEIVNNC